MTTTTNRKSARPALDPCRAPLRSLVSSRQRTAVEGEGKKSNLKLIRQKKRSNLIKTGGLMSYRLDLTLHCLPKSLNKKLRWGAKWANVKENKGFDLLIAGMTARKLPEKPLKRARISIVRHSWRTLDFDGLVGSMKPVVDALVSAGVLANDDWKTLGAWDIDQQFRPKKEGPLLTISVVELYETAIP